MTDFAATGFGDVIARRIRAEHIPISARWLERLRGLLTVHENEVFPTDHLLDHIPSLIQDIADYIRAPETEAVVANTWITTKAQELGKLRHAQRASVHPRATYSCRMRPHVPTFEAAAAARGGLQQRGPAPSPPFLPEEEQLSYG